MWKRETFDMLVATLPFVVSVEWDRKPSYEKYFRVNTLLACLRYLYTSSSRLLTLDGAEMRILKIAPLRRKLCDKHKQKFTIVGHETAQPLLSFLHNQLNYHLYFNCHLFVETQSTFRQYYPSATIIIRALDFLYGYPTRAPGSWGSDIIWMTDDPEGTLVIETALKDVSRTIRKQFRGFKLVHSSYKYFLAADALPQKEQRFVMNNGFEIYSPVAVLKAAEDKLSTVLSNFLKVQESRRGCNE